MAMIRLQPFSTTLTAAGTAGGLLTMADTSGITRHACLSIAGTGEGWRVEVIRVIDGTKVLARKTGFMAVSSDQPHQGNPQNLSDITDGAAVLVEEQWVPDLYQDDVPATLSIPVK